MFGLLSITLLHVNYCYVHTTSFQLGRMHYLPQFVVGRPDTLHTGGEQSGGQTCHVTQGKAIYLPLLCDTLLLRQKTILNCHLDLPRLPPPGPCPTVEKDICF